MLPPTPLASMQPKRPTPCAAVYTEQQAGAAGNNKVFSLCCGCDWSSITCEVIAVV